MGKTAKTMIVLGYLVTCLIVLVAYVSFLRRAEQARGGPCADCADKAHANGRATYVVDAEEVVTHAADA